MKERKEGRGGKRRDLDGSTVAFNVDDISSLDAFLLDVFVHRGIETQLLAALGGSEGDEDV